MPRKTLDERYEEDPARRDSEDSDRELNEERPSPEGRPSPSPQAGGGDGEAASVVPPDADRTEILQALRRLAALPEEQESPDESRSGAKAGTAGASESDTEQPPEGDVDTADVRSAFERVEERRGVSQDVPEPPGESADAGDSEKDAAQLGEKTASGEAQSARSEEPRPVAERPSEKAGGPQTAQEEPKRRGVFQWVRRRDLIRGMGSVKEATTVTIESGMMKILSTRMLDVVDYRVVPLSPDLYAGGVVVDATTTSRHLAAALADMKGAHRRVYAAIPGYQSAMRRLDLPDVREIDPNEVIPREARRVLGVAVDNSTLRWRKLPGRSRIARWLVAASSETSYSAITAVVNGTGHKIRALELRPFALTRAVGHPTMVCVFASSDGCDVAVVREWEPHTCQSVYWEAGSVSDGADLARRLSEIVENTIDLHNLHNPEVSLTPDVPLALAGGEAERHADLGTMLAANAGRDLVEGRNPLNAPDDFPYRSFAVNVGLALWDV